MSRIRDLLVVALVLVFAGQASAGWFGPSPEEITIAVQKYFQKPEATLDDFIGLDLANIDTDRDAKGLSKALEPMVKPLRTEVEQMALALEAKGPEVDRFFKILYAKELHDQLWLQTRPLKQAAYKKALTEYTSLLKELRARNTALLLSDHVLDSLNGIAKNFEEIKP
jgi:hypothetical protein